MLVQLRPEVFAPAHHLELLVLLWLGSVGRHRVVPQPLDQAAHAAWVERLDDDTRGVWEIMVEESLDRERLHPAHWQIELTATGDPAWQRPVPLLPIGAALDVLLQPYRVVLENNVNDRAFLLALGGRDGAGALREAERRAWLVFEMGGGSTVVPRIREIRRAEALRRMASVLVDSDAMRPPGPGERREDVEGDQARLVRRVAGEPLVGVHLHVLRRRAIENYLPVATLRREAAADERVLNALARLSDEQRCHFNMKEGFDRDAKDPHHAARVGGLYDSLPARDRERLRRGFGTDVARLFAGRVREGEVDDGARAEVEAFVAEILTRMR